VTPEERQDAIDRLTATSGRLTDRAATAPTAGERRTYGRQVTEVERKIRDLEAGS